MLVRPCPGRAVVGAALLLVLACDERQRAEQEARDRTVDARIDQLDASIAQVDVRIAQLDARLKLLEQRQAAGGLVPPPALEPSQITVVMTKEGLQVNGAPTDLAALESALKAGVARDPTLRLVLQSAPEVEHARVVALLDLAKRLGISKIAMTTDGPAPRP